MCHENLLRTLVAFLNSMQGRHFQMRATWHMTCRTIPGLRRCSQWISHSILLGSSLSYYFSIWFFIILYFLIHSYSLIIIFFLLISYLLSSLSFSVPIIFLSFSFSSLVILLLHLLLNSVAIGGCKNLRRIRNPQVPRGLWKLCPMWAFGGPRTAKKSLKNIMKAHWLLCLEHVLNFSLFGMRFLR